MSIYHKIYHNDTTQLFYENITTESLHQTHLDNSYYTTESYFTTLKNNFNNSIPVGYYDNKLHFFGQAKIIVDALTDFIIVFLLISVFSNFLIVILSVIYSNKCKKKPKIHISEYDEILNTIFVKNDMKSLSIEDVSLIFDKYNYTNIDINGEKLYYIFNLEDYDEIFNELNHHIVDKNIDYKIKRSCDNYNVQYDINNVINSIVECKDDNDISVLDLFDSEESVDISNQSVDLSNQNVDISKNSINKYTFSQDYDRIKDEFKHHSNEDLYEINKRKLDAEISIGVLSAIIMGFSISVYRLENYKNYDDFLFNVLNYIHVFIKSVVSGLSMLNVISSTTVYFTGMSIISRRHRNNQIMLKDFDKWWDNIETTRIVIRYCFIYCLPMFLISFVTNPDIWINNIILAIFNLVIIYTSVVVGTVSYCKLIF